MRKAMPKRSIVCAALLVMAASAAAGTPAWVERSNRIAEEVLRDGAQFFPEWPSSTGLEEFDTAVADLGPNYVERALAQTEMRLAALRELHTAETDRKVRQDLEVLIASREQRIETTRLEHRFLIDYVYAPGTVNFGLSSLLDPRNRPERQARALERLKRYAGLAPGTIPIATQARARTEEELARPGLIGPYAEDVRQQLAKTEFFLKGLPVQFERAKLQGWQADLELLSKQLREYNEWLRQNLLPRARTEIRLPPEIYANRLKLAGVAIGPEELIERSGADYQEVREQMQLLAKEIAARRKLASADYRQVLRELKKPQVEGKAMLAMYRGVLKDIEAIIRREKLISLPAREAAIRFATDSEAAAQPAPQMRIPRLIGNKGEYGEFLITRSNPHAKSGARMDDFSYKAVAWTLTAHEARPGHELQFASMVERGVSMARAIFAFNNANVEGWALYAEALMLPYMPPEAQLVSLQWRLLRMARAFLDPMVNLGQITPAEAKRILMEDVVLSEPFAQQEVDRYAFEMPGQATAYYYGYLQLRSLRTRAEIALGPKFDLMAFNDFIIAQGLLPPRVLQRAVMEEFVRERSKPAP
jgi:uncharacterized protein (DUF885 family)